MAKQSFSVGQVLTANQMLSLQQTAMLGGSATAKTASYTLVAADAGTVVSVNSTSATTITVNTGLFSAGDTVTIQNWGSGLVTITAGTATVNTAGSLIVPQYDGGVLYFTSASAAIYFDFVQAGAVSPLTTKGDLYTFGSSDTRIGVGANDTVLTADSSTATGLKWAAPGGAGANWTLLNSGGTSLSGSTTTISGISGADKIFILIDQASTTNNYATLYVRLNGDTGNNYYQYGQKFSGALNYAANIFDPENLNDTGVRFATQGSSNTGSSSGYFSLTGGNSSGVKFFTVAAAMSTGGGDQTAGRNQGGYYNTSSVITSVSLRTDSGTWDNGTVYVYTSA
jgi:hypothetical protein